MTRKSLIILVLIEFSFFSFSQDKKDFFSIINRNTFDTTIIAQRKIKSVLIQRYHPVNNICNLINTIKVYFDNTGQIVKINTIENESIAECFENDKLNEFYNRFNNPFFINDSYTYSWANSVEEDISRDVKNVLIETFGCFIKQTYFQNRLPTIINELKSPAFEFPLTYTYFSYCTEDSVIIKKSLTKPLK